MKTVVAYIVGIVLSQFCLTVGALGAAVLGMLLCWLPEKIRVMCVPFCSFLGGVVGSVFSVGLAYFVFKRIIGPVPFGIGPFLAATVPLSIPIYNDFKKARQLVDLQPGLPERAATYASPSISAMRALVVGEIAGIAVTAIFFL